MTTTTLLTLTFVSSDRVTHPINHQVIVTSYLKSITISAEDGDPRALRMITVRGSIKLIDERKNLVQLR